LFDGTGLDWNAGETALRCKVVPYPSGCSSAERSAEVNLYWESMQGISRIRLQENGDTNTETTKIFIGEGSAEDSAVTQVAEFRAPIRQDEWLEYPYPIQTGSPTISLSVNGGTDVSVIKGDVITLAWDITNANIVSFGGISGISPTCQIINPFLDLYYSLQVPRYDNLQPQISFKSDGWVLSQLWLESYYDNCLKGSAHTITLKARQRYSGTENQASVILRTD
jgi:hypothetical protein